MRWSTLDQKILCAIESRIQANEVLDQDDVQWLIDTIFDLLQQLEECEQP